MPQQFQPSFGETNPSHPIHSIGSRSRQGIASPLHLIALAALLLVPSGAAEPPKASPPSANAKPPAKPKPYTHPLSVTGHAFDSEGLPIAEARVYLIAGGRGYRRLAETTTDVEGQYIFRDVPLPISPSENRGLRDFGAFQVYGEADDFGFAWRPEKWIFTSPKPKPPSSTYEPSPLDPPNRFEASDSIVLDLHFSPASRIKGTIVDDRGTPISGARLEIRDCEWLKVVDNVVGGWALPALNEREVIPSSTKVRITDSEGRFDFTGLPVDSRFRIAFRAKGLPDRWIQAATAGEPQPDHFGSPVYTGDLKLVFATPLDVPIRVVYGDTGKPAHKVAVQAGSGEVSILETSDKAGLAVLKLPPGKYRLGLLPAHQTDYLLTDDELVVEKKPPNSPIVAKLQPAAVVEVIVTDAETGTGIPDVELWEQTGSDHAQRELLYFRSWEVATRTAHVERPRTDASGKLRALIPPGKHRLGVGWQSAPPFFEAIESRGQEAEFRAGETTKLRFTMRRRP